MLGYIGLYTLPPTISSLTFWKNGHKLALVLKPSKITSSCNNATLVLQFAQYNRCPSPPALLLHPQILLYLLQYAVMSR